MRREKNGFAFMKFIAIGNFFSLHVCITSLLVDIFAQNMKVLVKSLLSIYRISHSVQTLFPGIGCSDCVSRLDFFLG